MIAKENNLSKESTPKRYRLVVRSAEEAVRMIREKLGENAKVVSVRQTGGEGLKRFISSPKLEVIAEVTEPSLSVTPSNPEDGAATKTADNQDARLPALMLPHPRL